MIGVEILESGQFLELFDDTFIDLRLNNPLFADDDVVPGSISLPFEVPGSATSPINSLLLKHPEVVSNRLALHKTAARLWFIGTPWKGGMITVRTATPERISLNFTFGLTAATEDFRKKRIRDLLDEVVTMASNDFTKRVTIRLTNALSERKININDKEYHFQGFNTSPDGPIINGTTYVAFPNTTNGANEALAQCINDTSPNGVVAAYDGGFIEVSVLEENSLEAPLKIRTDSVTNWFMSGADFQAEYNSPIEDYLNDNFSIGASDPGDILNKIRFPVCANHLHENDLVRKGAVNYYDSIRYRLNSPVGSFPEPENNTSTCPFVRWKYVLDKVLEELGIAGVGDFLEDEDLAAGLIPHSNTLDIPVNIAGSKDWLACARQFNIKDFVPDWTIPEFLKALQKCFNLGIEYNERTHRIEFSLRENMHADRTYNDIRSKCAPITSVEPQDVTTVRLKVIRNSRDQFSIDDQIELGEGPSLLEIPSEISGWYKQENIVFTGNHTWNVPMASLKRDSSITPAMIFYEEKTSGGAGTPFDYPGANIDLSDCTFALAGAGGRAMARWKRHLRFLLNRRSIPLDVSFEFRELLNIDWKRKVRPTEGLNCYLNSVHVRLTMKGIEASKCELWTTDLGILPEE